MTSNQTEEANFCKCGKETVSALSLTRVDYGGRNPAIAFLWAKYVWKTTASGLDRTQVVFLKMPLATDKYIH